MFDLIATIAGISLVMKAKTDAQKIVGGAILSAALNSSFRSIKGA
jgi:hypothetical protein